MTKPQAVNLQTYSITPFRGFTKTGSDSGISLVWKLIPLNGYMWNQEATGETSNPDTARSQDKRVERHDVANRDEREELYKDPR